MSTLPFADVVFNMISTKPVFMNLLKTPNRFSSPSANAGMALIYTDINIPNDALLAQQLMPLNNPFFLNPQTQTDVFYSYQYPLMVMNNFFSFSLPNITDAFLTSSNWNDFKQNINTLSLGCVYADYTAILSFYEYPSTSIPRINASLFNKNFSNLTRLMNEPVQSFLATPKDLFTSKSSLTIPKITSLYANDVGGEMAVYLMNTDILWTKVLHISFAQFLLANPMPSFGELNMSLQPNVQRFFHYYSSGVQHLIQKKTLSYQEYMILTMTWEMDKICYNNWTNFHAMAGVLPDSFVEQMNIFQDNITYTLTKLKNATYK